MTHDTHTAREKAEAYVRGKLPELMETIYPAGDQSFFYLVEDMGDHWRGIWHGTTKVVNIHKTTAYGSRDAKELALQHWLRVLEKNNVCAFDGKGCLVVMNPFEAEPHRCHVKFNLLTGQPATEADYQAFNDIVGV